MSIFDNPPIDPAMLELFQAEMDTHIPVLNEGLLALEKGQAGAREIDAMMRAAHSIKGAARIVGIEPAVRVAHVMEDCFTAAKDSKITLTSDAVDVLLQGVDALQRICAPLAGSPLAEAAMTELLDRLSVLKSGRVPAAPAVTAQTELVAATVEPAEPSIMLPATLGEASAQSLRRELLDALALGSGKIKLDFVQVGELSAGALALLVSFARAVGNAQPTPAIESLRMCPAVRTVIRIAGLDAAFGVGR